MLPFLIRPEAREGVFPKGGGGRLEVYKTWPRIWYCRLPQASHACDKNLVGASIWGQGREGGVRRKSLKHASVPIKRSLPPKRLLCESCCVICGGALCLR